MLRCGSFESSARYALENRFTLFKTYFEMKNGTRTDMTNVRQIFTLLSYFFFFFPNMAYRNFKIRLLNCDTLQWTAALFIIIRFVEPHILHQLSHIDFTIICWPAKLKIIIIAYQQRFWWISLTTTQIFVNQ